MNVKNEPVQEMFCAVKRETLPVWRWKLCEFQHRKSIQPVPCKIKLEMLDEMVTEILNGGEILVNCKFKLNKISI